MDYKIAILRQAYSPDMQGIEHPTFLAEDDGQGDWTGDLDVAKARVEALDGDTYVTTNGESGRPEYIIVPEDTEIGHESLDMYNWDDNDCTANANNDSTPCGECAQCIDMMIDQDRDMIRNAEITE